MNFRTYINSLRNLLGKGQCNKFVLGNSGADYDSVVGSLIYAFYMTASFKVLYLPLINCKQADLPLRFQITTVFDSLQIAPSQLLYTEMIPNLWSKNNTFALYDHNLRAELSPENIDQIVDHHAYDPSTIKCNHLISHCGSALTLLYYLYHPHLLTKFQSTQLYKKYMIYFEKHRPIAKDALPEDMKIINQLIYYGILIDSYGLSQKQAHIWNQFDKFAIQNLQKQIAPKFQFDDIGASKFDIHKNLKLSLEQQRTKDYKCIKYGDITINYYTILLNIDAFITRYWQQITEQLNVQKMQINQVHAFMFSFPKSDSKQDINSGNFRKFILFNSPNKNIVQKIQNIMKELNFEKLEDVAGWSKWTDPTDRISRKIFDKQLKSRL